MCIGIWKWGWGTRDLIRSRPKRVQEVKSSLFPRGASVARKSCAGGGKLDENHAGLTTGNELARGVPTAV